MRTLARLVGWLVLVQVAAPNQLDARDAARDLRRLTGYCILDSATVDQVSTSNVGEKYVRLANSMTFKVHFLFLNPLPLTDVVILAKPLPQALVEQFRGKVPEWRLYSYRLLIDNEVFDAEPVRP
jgi:hypothetical protein